MDSIPLENDVFEINDFTNASAWEKFVSEIEEILRDWQHGEESSDDLSQLDQVASEFLESNGEDSSIVRCRILHYNGKRYKLTLYSSSSCEYNPRNVEYSPTRKGLFNKYLVSGGSINEYETA
eukprot:Sdes_comp14730_c0_seq1m3560